MSASTVLASPNRAVALVVGALLVVWGGVEVLARLGRPLFEPDGTLLLGVFDGNVLLGIAHLVTGAALALAAPAGIRRAQIANEALGTVFLAIGFAGLFVIGTPLNVLALNGADNALHFALAVLLLGTGMGTERRIARPA